MGNRGRQLTSLRPCQYKIRRSAQAAKTANIAISTANISAAPPNTDRPTGKANIMPKNTDEPIAT